MPVSVRLTCHMLFVVSCVTPRCFSGVDGATEKHAWEMTGSSCVAAAPGDIGMAVILLASWQEIQKYPLLCHQTTELVLALGFETPKFIISTALHYK